MYLHDPSLLNNLRLRYEHDRIYTYTAYILIALNPYKQIGVYNKEAMLKYRGKAIGQQPPHVFAVADRAYRNMKSTATNQSLVVSGESGAGKTENCKFIMRYLATVGGAKAGELGELERRVIEANPLLESFGNAKTTKNHNSSRFGKFTQIHFNGQGELVGASIETYVLEKSRVTRQMEGERNFHCFYRLCRGASAEERAKWFLLEPKDYFYLTRGHMTDISNEWNDVDGYKELREAMTCVGLTADEQDGVLRIVAAVLWLGNITFKQWGQDACAIKSAKALDNCAKLLGLPTERLQNGLTKRLIRMRGGKETVAKPLKLFEAEYARDALAKAIYQRLFNWIVVRVNQSLPCKDSRMFIGVLDIAGFEFFKSNSFEQFCINYANECLQQFFNAEVLVQEQEIYEKEGLRFKRLDYKDNQDTINLIASPSNPMGIISCLDEECRMPQSSDNRLCARIYKTHGAHERLFESKRAPNKADRRFTQEEAFVIDHFASPVCYQINGFVDKNNDALHLDLEDLIFASSEPMVVNVFGVGQTRDDPDSPAPKGGQLHFKSVSSKFRDQLNELMTTLRNTEASFVRCIKPNEQQKPNCFEGASVLHQLRCSGMSDALHLMQQGWPTRCPCDDLYNMYSSLMPPVLKQMSARDFSEAVLYALDLDRTDFQFGLTKLFFRAGKLAFLDQLFVTTDAMSQKGIIEKVQKWLIRKRWRRSGWSVVAFHHAQRLLLALRAITWWARMARAAKYVCRTIRYAQRVKQRRKAAMFVQKYVKGWIVYRRMLSARMALRSARIERERREREIKEAERLRLEEEKRRLAADEARQAAMKAQVEAEERAKQQEEEKQKAAQRASERAEEYEKQLEAERQRLVAEANKRRAAEEQRKKQVEQAARREVQLREESQRALKAAEEAAQKRAEEERRIKEAELARAQEQQRQAMEAAQIEAEEVKRRLQQQVERERHLRMENEAEAASRAEESEQRRESVQRELDAEREMAAEANSRSQREKLALQTEIGALKDQLAETASSASASTERVQQSQRRLMSEMEELRSRLSLEEDARAAAESESRRLTVALQGAQSSLSDAELARQSGNRDTSQLRGQIEDLQGQLDSARMDLARSQRESNQAKESTQLEMDDISSQIAALRAKLDAERQAHATTRRQLAAVEEERTATSSKLDSAVAAERSLRAEIEDLTDQLDRIRRQADQAKSLAMSQVEEASSMANSTSERLTRQIRRLTEELAGVRAQSDIANEEIERLEIDLARTKSACDEARALAAEEESRRLLAERATASAKAEAIRAQEEAEQTQLELSRDVSIGGASEHEVAMLESAIETSRQSLENEKSLHSAARKAKQLAEDASRAAEQKNEALVRQLAEAKERAEEAESLAATTRRELEQSKAEAIEQKHLAEEGQLATNQRDRQALKRAEAAIEDLQERLEAEEDAKENMRAELLRAKAEVEEARADTEAAEKDQKSTERALAVTRRELDDANAAFAAAEQAITRANREAATREREAFDGIHDELETAQSALETERAARRKIKAELRAAQSELASGGAARETAERLRADLKAVKTELQSVDGARSREAKRAAEAEANATEVSAQMVDLQTETESMRRRWRKAQEEISQLRDQLEDAMEAVPATNPDSTVAVKDLEAKLQVQTEATDRAEAELRKARELVREREDDIKTMELLKRQNERNERQSKTQIAQLQAELEVALEGQKKAGRELRRARRMSGMKPDGGGGGGARPRTITSVGAAVMLASSRPKKPRSLSKVAELGGWTNVEGEGEESQE